jgi:aspartate carbamoyltransferase catalytic subunit
VVKGEILKDTGRNLQAMSPDLVVIRHSCAGAPAILAETLPAAIINAGDGAHAHPTQALLDAFTIREKKGAIDGLTVAIIGDITHSRVARSNIEALNKMGAKVVVYGPFSMMPAGIEEMGVRVATSMEDALTDADVIMMLRIQMERQSRFLFPSVREYASFFGLNGERLTKAKKDVLIMHPGPINRGVEISPEVADGPYALILDQVANGVAVRMALLYLLIS